MNIVVLAGGTSTERDVSIVTGTMVCKALRRNGHNAIVVDVFLGYEKNVTSTLEAFNDREDLDELAVHLKEKSSLINNLVVERETEGGGFFGSNVLELCKASDIVFMGLHGSNGEDGKIQGTFDLLGIKYTGTGYLSSAIAMNKDITKSVLLSDGVPMPKGIKVTKKNLDKNVEISFPCVVKPCCGGSSVGVSIVRNQEEYESALEEAFSCEDGVVVEDYIEGREFSIGVIEGKALPIIEIEPLNGFYDYKNKYNAGLTKETCPANLEESIAIKMQSYAEQACKAIGLETYGRVDFLLNKNNEIFCLEINTLPGMTATSLLPQEAEVIGMTYDELCNRIIDISLKKYQ